MNDPAQAQITTTPQIEQIDLPASVKSFLSAMAAQIAQLDDGQWILKPVPAFEVCLTIAKGDPRAATTLFTYLVDGVSEWNDAHKDQRHTTGYPFP